MAKGTRIASRIWTDVTGLVLPLVATAAYVLDPSSPVTTVLIVVMVGGLVGPWIADRAWRPWGVRIARALPRARRRHAAD
jgi:hypothetical protein